MSDLAASLVLPGFLGLGAAIVAIAAGNYKRTHLVPIALAVAIVTVIIVASMVNIPPPVFAAAAGIGAALAGANLTGVWRYDPEWKRKIHPLVMMGIGAMIIVAGVGIARGAFSNPIADPNIKKNTTDGSAPGDSGGPMAGDKDTDTPGVEGGAEPPRIDPQLERMRREFDTWVKEVKKGGSDEGFRVSAEQKSRLFDLSLEAVETFLPFVSKPRELATDLASKFLEEFASSTGGNASDLLFKWLEGRLERRAAKEDPPRATASVSVVRFEFGSAEIPQSGQQTIIDITAADNGGFITVVGFTDRAGRERGNYELAGQRAAAVEELLVTRGARPGRIIAYGVSEMALPYPTADGVREPENRRVEITVGT